MRLTIFLFGIFLSGQTFCQADANKNCKPDTDIKVHFCGSSSIKDSICPACFDCDTRLITSDTNFLVISFVITVGGEGFDDHIYEATNTGPHFTSPLVMNIISRMKKGSYAEFTCIKAKHKDGHLYTLQPLFIQL